MENEGEECKGCVLGMWCLPVKRENVDIIIINVKVLLIVQCLKVSQELKGEKLCLV